MKRACEGWLKITSVHCLFKVASRILSIPSTSDNNPANNKPYKSQQQTKWLNSHGSRKWEAAIKLKEGLQRINKLRSEDCDIITL